MTRVDRGCNLGYYKNGLLCGSCATMAGRYSDVSTYTACWFCTNKPLENSYYLMPKAIGGFNATTNKCPWYTHTLFFVWVWDSLFFNFLLLILPKTI